MPRGSYAPHGVKTNNFVYDKYVVECSPDCKNHYYPEKDMTFNMQHGKATHFCLNKLSL